MPRLTLVYSLKNAFVARDLAHFKALGITVNELQSPPYKFLPLFFWNRLRELFLGLWQVLNSTTVVVWFSDYHGFFPLLWARLCHKKSILIVGGYDAVADHANSHGIFIKHNLRRKIALQNFKWASEIWAVDQSLIYGCPQAQQQFGVVSGIAHFAPQQLSKCKTVPTGYDSSFWHTVAEKKEKTLLTVGLFTDKRVAERKGIPDFLALAAQHPEFNCVIIGEENNSITANYSLPPNVEVRPKSTPQELRQAYSEAQFYFQGSRVEGLPNVLCEAMLCKCIPIGRKVFGIPKAISTTGMLYDTAVGLAAISTFLTKKHPKLKGQVARQQILSNFSQRKRRAAFKQALLNVKPIQDA